MKQYSIKKQAMKKGGRQMLSEDVQNRIHFSLRIDVHVTQITVHIDYRHLQVLLILTFYQVIHISRYNYSDILLI